MVLAVVAIVALVETLSAVRTTAQDWGAMVTAATNVRVRAEPSEEVRIVATLPLGTDLVELGRSATGEWVRVRLGDGTDGWILAALTRTVPAGQRQRVLEAIVQRRLSQSGVAFRDCLELLDVIERLRAHSEDAETTARLALFRLQTLRQAVVTIDRGDRLVPAVAEWIGAHRSLLVYNEPGGQWMLRREVILAEFERHRETRSAQQIAWLSVRNGLPGECEGQVACYAERAGLLEGEYLRQYPSGVFTGMAMRQLLEQAISWKSIIDEWQIFTPTDDCSHLKEPLAALRAAVAGVMPSRGDATLQAATLQALDDVGRLCG